MPQRAGPARLRVGRVPALLRASLRPGMAHVEDDLDLVAHLQRAHQPAIGLDAPLALADLVRGPRPAALVAHVDEHRALGPGQRQVAVDHEHAVVLLGREAGERDGLAAQDLLVDGLEDLVAVLLAERLDAPQPLAQAQRARVGRELDPVAFDRGLPFGHVDHEVVTDLRGDALPIGLDDERAVPGPDGWHVRDANASGATGNGGTPMRARDLGPCTTRTSRW